MKVRGYDKGQPVMINVVEVAPGKFLQADTAEAFLRMQVAAKNDGIELKPNSCWRSFAHQQLLWDQWEQGTRKLRPARPGYSRHHMGTAVDINRSHDDPDGSGPLPSKTDEWLRANAERFGFRNTVTKEPWHWEWDAVRE